MRSFHRLLLPFLAPKPHHHHHNHKHHPSLQHLSLFSTTKPNATTSVALLWDLTTSKPPSTLPIYDAAVRLHLAASSFGRLHLSLAFSFPTSLLPIPKPSSSSSSPNNICRVCGRRFQARDALLAHFDVIHAREHAKRLRRIDSARGGRRIRLAASLSLKNSKYEKAARELLTTNSLTDELHRARIKLHTDRNASSALRDYVEEVIATERRFQCVMLVSGDVELSSAVREARERNVRTVVVGAEERLLRWADAGFTWQEVIAGKARKAATSVTGKWRDKQVLKRLEWRYEGEDDGDVVFDGDTEEEEDAGGLMGKREAKPWWKLGSDTEDDSRVRDAK